MCSASCAPAAESGSATASPRTPRPKQLQVTLVELIALSLAGKQLHWNTYGPDFLSLHRHLDGLVDEWRTLADTVAERQATIGIAPEGSAQPSSSSAISRLSSPDSPKSAARSSTSAYNSAR
jgi:DNA-binding ferritin-like protein